MRLTTCSFAVCWLSCAAATSDSRPAAAPQAAIGATARQDVPVHPAPTLPNPDWLPSEAKAMLQSRMERHGEEMMLLLLSVVTLQHEDTELLAEYVAARPRIDRPQSEDTLSVSALLPPRFFDLQDQLLERAQAVSAAARAQDDARIVRAYGRLAETCVSCHSVYLSPNQASQLPGD